MFIYFNNTSGALNYLKKRNFLFKIIFVGICQLTVTAVKAQNSYGLNKRWKCLPVEQTRQDGFAISNPASALTNWQPAVVPGTVLTTLLANKEIPDPFYGMNNEQIPDIYSIGAKHYTYWFVNDFEETNGAGKQVYLNLRGVNYSCEIYLNGHKVNPKTHYGMFLRQEYNVTALLNKSGNNRLAILVYPPQIVGNPNGGQGGDGTIARNVSIQYTAGWDWIQPVRDRNTGIWDKVTIIKTGSIHIKDPHIITLVPGIRHIEGPQQPATIQVSADLENPASKKVTGRLQYTLDGQMVSKSVTIQPKSTLNVQLNNLSLKNPKLWWPNGYGPQNLYDLKIQFSAGKAVSDEAHVSVGIRQIETSWNAVTNSRQIAVNGQKIFIKGGNWVISDAMLRFSDARYDAEVRFHRDMNLNLIRVWGGALVERPEFYAACDKYGLLVFQDLWISGDCNGKWLDAAKLDDQWTRRSYPDDHNLFLASAADQIKMIRNHASLAVWCGGNEITPPEDILIPLRDSILPILDGTRWFVDYSNSDKMSLNTEGGNGDGPYCIQTNQYFWEHRSFPFNSELGSVGMGDYESLERFIPKNDLVAPKYPLEKTNPVWDYHKYIGYDNAIKPYGETNDLRDFAKKAQLVNYDQYRALAEGFSNQMWDWYTGIIIWKTQNPWTALRGQMYDYYLDPNACLYGLRSGSEPLHPMYNPVDGMISVVNNSFETQRDIMLSVSTYDMAGKKKQLTQVFAEVQPSASKKFLSVSKAVEAAAKNKGVFLVLKLQDKNKNALSENLYWLPDEKGNYSGLQEMPGSKLQVAASIAGKGKAMVTLTNPVDAPVAFFNRLSIVNSQTQKRLLPVFYSENYISVLPGESKKVLIDFSTADNAQSPVLSISGWNLPGQLIDINK